jgi:hypothetical protein
VRAAVVLTLFLTACVQHSFVADRLYCGLSIPGGGVVSQADLDAFVAEVVEPRFPDGFTLWRARGQWRGGSEDSLVIEIVHAPGPQFDRAVQEIADAYRTRFRQEAVLRVIAPVRMQLLASPRP